MFDVFNASDLHVSCRFLRLVIDGFGCDMIEALVEIILCSPNAFSRGLMSSYLWPAFFLFIAGLKISSE